MAAITTAVIAIAGLVLGWIAIEIACKPCLDKGREAIDHSLNPDYDHDDENDVVSGIRAPLNPADPDPEDSDPKAATAAGASSASSNLIKVV